MINSEVARRRLSEVEDKIGAMKNDLAVAQSEYDDLSINYAELTAAHTGKTRRPKAFKVQEKNLAAKKLKISALEHSIELYTDKQEEVQRMLHLATLYETEASAFLKAEDQFAVTAEAVADAASQLKMTANRYCGLVERLVAEAGLTVEHVKVVLEDSAMSGVSLREFLRHGEVEEAESDDFVQSLGNRYREIASNVKLLDAECISELQRWSKVLSEWVTIVGTSRWPDVVHEGATSLVPKSLKYAQTGAEPGIKIVSQTIRIPTTPPIDYAAKKEFDAIQRNRAMVKTVNCNKIIGSADESV